MAALLYGFMNMTDILTQRAIAVDRTLLMSAIEQTVEQHNAEVNGLLSLFSEDTTEYKLLFRGQKATRNQPLDENGRSRPIKGRVFYETAFPIFGSGNAWGINYTARQKISVQDLNDNTSDLLIGDFRRTRDDLFSALFNNSTRNFTDENYGTLVVRGLANGDGVLYNLVGQDAPQTDNHYLFQAAAVADATNPYPALRTELREHPDNATGEQITFVASDVEALTQNLATFLPIIGAYPGTGDPAVKLPITVPQLQVNFPNIILPPGARAVGRVAEQWIVNWPSLPTGYIVSVISDGVRPMLRRQDPEPELNGFRPVATRQDFPYFEEQWIRRQGFGGWNRIKACVMQTGSGSYNIPTGYTAFVP